VTDEPITILVADDHTVVRRGIIGLLRAETDLEIVADVADGQAAVQAAVRHRPAVVLMDLRMPVMGGVEATGQIRARVPEAAVLVLTTYDTDEAIVRAVEAGAAGYLLKDTEPDDLVAAIRLAAAGETVFGGAVAKRLADQGRQANNRSLTAREIEILRHVAAGNTNAAIAHNLHISEATVKTHLLHIYDKLGASDRAAAVARGYETSILTP